VTTPYLSQGAPVRLLFSLSTALLLAGCSAGNDQVIVETVVVTETAAADAAGPRSTLAGEDTVSGDQLADAYLRALQDPPVHAEDRGSRFHPTGTWSYAIVEATGDDRPDMLLRVDSREFARIHLYTTDADGQLLRSTDYLIDGAAGNGGSRVRLEGSRAGAGVYQIDYMSMQREGTSTLYRPEGTSLVKAGEPTVFEALGALPDHEELTWFPSTDHSGLEVVRTGARHSPAPTAPQLETGPTAGQIRFTGVVSEKSTSEMMRGERSPNGEPESNRYYTLILDEPREITAFHGPGDPYTQRMSEISLGEKSVYRDNSAEWAPWVGRRITLDVDPGNMAYPTDASMPVGMLRVWDAVVSG